MNTQEKEKVPATLDGKTVSYTVAGNEVNLSFTTVRKYLVRGDAEVTDAEVVLFINICRFNQLNPFLNEAYLIKFKGSAAQMVVSKEAFMKRAEACREYEGMKAGLIIKRGDDMLEVEGTFTLPNDVLLGGWAEVYRKDRKYPIVAKVSLSEYDKKQSSWNAKKATMIRKVAIVQAMREAFPAQTGAMYTAEEQGVQDVEYVDVSDKVSKEIAENANAGQTIGFTDAAQQSREEIQPAQPQPQSKQFNAPF
jgi:phage recombination protein Bet